LLELVFEAFIVTFGNMDEVELEISHSHITELRCLLFYNMLDVSNSLALVNLDRKDTVDIVMVDPTLEHDYFHLVVPNPQKHVILTLGSRAWICCLNLSITRVYVPCNKMRQATLSTP